jgi:hypothetical protein
MIVAAGCVCGLLSASPATAGSATDATLFYDAVRNQPALFKDYGPSPGQDAVDTEEADAQRYGYRWRGKPPDQPDWQGVRRDTVYFLGYQLAIIGALYISPESISGWDSDDKDDFSLNKWHDNVSNPEWDEDRWWINYVLHPYWGGAYYIRGRERGLDKTQAFWYGALLSTLYEYGAEAMFEPVSVQDLFVTPIVGFFLGEYLFAPWRERIRAKSGSLSWADKAALFFTDPLGVANAETDRVLGVKTSLQLAPVNLRQPHHLSEMGSSVALPGLDRNPAPVWGLQFSIEW